MFLLEVTWWAHRALWHLIFAGVMERHPALQFVFTEQGTAWIPDELLRARLLLRPDAGSGGRLAGARVGRRVIGRLSLQAERVLGAAVPRRRELHPAGARWRCATRSASTGSCGAATTRTGGLLAVLAASACGWRSPASTRAEVAAMVGGNAAARLRLRPRRARARSRRAVGPAVDEVAEPLPPGATIPAERACAARRSPRRSAAAAGNHGDDEGRRMSTRSATAHARQEELRNREVEATSVGAWATRSSPSTRPTPTWSPRCCRRRSRRPTEPLVRVTVATVDLGRGRPPFGAGTFAVQAAPRGHRRRLPAGHADDDRAVGRSAGGRRSASRRSSAEVTLDRDGDRRSAGWFDPAWATTFVEVDGHGRRGAAGAARRPAHRLLLQVPARARRQGLRRRAVARLLPPRRDDPVAAPASTAR